MTTPEAVSAEPPEGGALARLSRAWFVVIGLIASAIGFIGVVVPGLPTTVFFIVAAWAFARSSPRLEAWVLGLPRIGRTVRDYREGLGMPRGAKIAAISLLGLSVMLSVTLGVSSWTARAIILAAGAIGVAYILWRVPTREQVLAARARGDID
jgi:hypothetical protein